MIEAITCLPESIVAGMMADYRFCAYRLDVLKHNPHADRASIEAVVGRMNQLALACRGVTPTAVPVPLTRTVAET